MAAPEKGAIRSTVSIKGSSRLVSEFFEYSINSILYQRGVYPAEDFKVVKKYGINVLVTTDEEVKAYIKRFMSQLSRWMKDEKIGKLVMVIVNKDDGEVLERWQFDVLVFGKDDIASVRTKSGQEGGDKENPRVGSQKEKTESEIHAEIQAIIRQITASVTFLPMLEGRCTFNILVYADQDAEVPEEEWGDSDALEVKNAENVKLRSFSTMSHKVDGLVSYRLDSEY